MTYSIAALSPKYHKVSPVFTAQSQAVNHCDCFYITDSLNIADASPTQGHRVWQWDEGVKDASDITPLVIANVILNR